MDVSNDSDSDDNHPLEDQYGVFQEDQSPGVSVDEEDRDEDNTDDDRSNATMQSEVATMDFYQDGTKVRSFWEKARRELSFLSRPTQQLKGREAEHEELFRTSFQMLQPAGRSGTCSGGIIFVSGVPGTGKTATTRIVSKQLSSKLKFHFIEIVAFKLPKPRMIFSYLWWLLNITFEQDLKSRGRGIETGAVDKKKKYMLAPDAAQAALDSYFGSNVSEEPSSIDFAKPYELVKYKPILLLLDEIETLLTKDQQILYTLFEWARSSTSQLVIVGIANMIDLPERVHHKIASRLGTSKIVFKPYQASQLKDILSAPMKPFEQFFAPDVLDHIARKVGSTRGDARLAFEICRRALEFAELDNEITKRRRDKNNNNNNSMNDMEEDEMQENTGSRNKQNVTTFDARAALALLDDDEEKQQQSPVDDDQMRTEQTDRDDEQFEAVPVSTQHVDRVLLAMRDSARCAALNSTSIHEQVLALSVVFEIVLRQQTRSGISSFAMERISKTTRMVLEEDITYLNLVHIRYEAFCTVLNIPSYSIAVTQRLCQRLCNLGTIIVNFKDRSLHKSIYLKLSQDEILNTLWTVSALQPLFAAQNIPALCGWEPPS